MPSKQPDSPGRSPVSTAAVPWWRRLYGLLRGRQHEEDEPLFTPGFLEAFERLRPEILKAAGGGLGGGRRLGAYKGGQLEFHDHRHYSPGDEPRYLDWNLYARLERLYIKEFAREETGVLHLLLDATASMRIGRPSKWTFVRRVAALFAHVALRAHDRVELHVFRGDGEKRAFPERGHGGTAGAAGTGTQQVEAPSSPAVLRFLEGQQAAPPASLSEEATAAAGNTKEGAEGKEREAAEPWAGAVWAFLRDRPPRGNVIMLGDFQQTEHDLSTAVSHLCAAGFDPAAIHVSAPEELRPPPREELRIISLEETETVEINAAAPEAATVFAAELERRRARVEDVFRRRGGFYLFVSSDTSIEKTLLQTLRRRGIMV